MTSRPVSLMSLAVVAGASLALPATGCAGECRSNRNVDGPKVVGDLQIQHSGEPSFKFDEKPLDSWPYGALSGPLMLDWTVAGRNLTLRLTLDNVPEIGVTELESVHAKLCVCEGPRSSASVKERLACQDGAISGWASCNDVRGQIHVNERARECGDDWAGTSVCADRVQMDVVLRSGNFVEGKIEVRVHQDLVSETCGAG